jgi:hypothetical protein
LGHIAGSRDDLFRRSYLGGDQLTNTPMRGAIHSSFSRVANLALHAWADMLHDVVRRIVACTGMPPLAVDLTRRDFNLPVVLVVAPGLRLVPPRRR